MSPLFSSETGTGAGSHPTRTFQSRDIGPSDPKGLWRVASPPRARPRRAGPPGSGILSPQHWYGRRQSLGRSTPSTVSSIGSAAVGSAMSIWRRTNLRSGWCWSPKRDVLRGLGRHLKSGTRCYRLDLGALCESSSPGGFGALPTRKESPMLPCWTLRIEPTKARSTPISVAESSSSGSPSLGKVDREATGPSSFSGGAPKRSSSKDTPRAGVRTSIPMKRGSSKRLPNTSWH